MTHQHRTGHDHVVYRVLIGRSSDPAFNETISEMIEISGHALAFNAGAASLFIEDDGSLSVDGAHASLPLMFVVPIANEERFQELAMRLHEIWDESGDGVFFIEQSSSGARQPTVSIN